MLLKSATALIIESFVLIKEAKTCSLMTSVLIEALEPLN
jgi:hypothetical protein